MNSLLLDLPMPIYTPRLIIRPQMPGDGMPLNTAIIESFNELHQYMPWATEKPSVEESESFARQAYADWITRKAFHFLAFNNSDNTLVGACGFHNIDWSVPSLETGYWLRTSCIGKGYATEYANALTQYAFKVLNVNRIAITCDPLNTRSATIAKRLHFIHEATLKNNRRRRDGTIGDTLIFARYDLEGLPALDVRW
jgi:ribosomal-protein-serine acetyltransferase